MKIKKVLSILCVLALIFTTLAACSQQTAATEPAAEPAAATEAPAAEAVTEEVEEDPGYDTEKVYEIKLTSNDPITAIWMQQIQAATERIKERTNGKVDIQVYASGEMLVGDEGIEAVMSNTAVFYFIAPSAFADYVPVYKTICAPYLWESYEDVEKFM
jgi:TRAP-type C4-dicarboxylate transport system substrate-binding protein